MKQFIPFVLITLCLLSCTRKKDAVDPVVLVQVTDTQMVYILYPDPDSEVSWLKGFALSTGLKKLNSRAWASQPNIEAYDSTYKLAKRGWIGIFPR